MANKKTETAFDLLSGLMAAYATNDRINHYMIDAIDDAAWRAEPPNGKGRGIASMIAHIHNVRLMWLKSAGKTDVLPDKLEGDTFTRADAVVALKASAAAIAAVLSEALAGDGRVKGFKPDAASFLGYLIAHDAHHRGQIAMVARQIGHPLSKSAGFGMWEWGTR